MGNRALFSDTFFQGILAKMKEGAENALAKAESVLKQSADHFKGMLESSEDNYSST